MTMITIADLNGISDPIPIKQNNVMKVLILLLGAMVFNASTIAQTFFSAIPDFGGDKHEGKIFNIIPLDDQIKVIGALHDSIVPGLDGGTWQLISSISYNGELLDTKLLVDSLYSDSYTYHKRRIVFKNDSICYIYDRRDIGNPKLNAYLLELNCKTGAILKSKIIYDTISTYTGFLATDLSIGKHGEIYLINVIYAEGENPQIITVLDSSFNIIHQSIIPNFGRDNITKFTEINSDGNLSLVGVSLGEETSVWFESRLFMQVLDSDYNSIDFKFAPTNLEQTILSFEQYPVIMSNSGDWIFSSQVVMSTNDCEFCSIAIPYVVSVSPDFSKVNWETRMFDGDINSSRPDYSVQSITEVSDGYIFLGHTDGNHDLETSALLGKVSLNGDSLWLKHIIPLQWDTAQAFWFKMQDIKTTQEGNILIGGFISDGINQIIVPWLAQLDKDGCMEPGCNTMVSTADPTDKDQEIFSVYPNPASSFIGINCTTDFSENCIISIYDYTGKAVTKMAFTPQPGYQYMINIPNQIHGAYVLSIESNSGQLLYSKGIVID